VVLGMRAALVLLVFVLLSMATPASATLPGRNGAVGFSAYKLSEESTDIVIDRQVVGIAPVSGAPWTFGFGHSPAFSPGGRKIAYVATDLHGDIWYGIWLARSDCRRQSNRRAAPPCSKLQRLTHGRFDDEPVWSPNGKRIAFERNDSRIYTVRATGGGRRLLIGGHDPDWSSTGALAYAAGYDGGGDSPIHVRGPGGRIRDLGVRGSGPSWAPSGDRLAFSKYNDRLGLYVINADGTGLRRIWAAKQDSDSQPVVPSEAAWSPDGRWIAFIRDSQDGFTEGAYAIRPSGRGLRVLIRLSNHISHFNYDDLAWPRLR
jgi:Tol biopolymer transport system component